MNTNTLIELLSREPIESRAVPFGIKLVGPLLLAGLSSFFLMSLLLGIQANLMQKMITSAFWLKFSFAFTLFLVGALITAKMAKPGKANSNYIVVVAVPVLLVWMIATWVARDPLSPPLLEMIEGSTWQVCSLLIASLSMPIFIAVFWSLRYMAPTRLRLTGFMAGLFSGGLAACIYCLHCPEYSPVFVGIWYLIGILIPALFGALLGKWILKW